MMPMLRSAARSYDEVTNYTAFIEACACLMTSTSSGGAAEKAKGLRNGERVQSVLKAASAASLTSNVGITFFGPELSAFMSALRQVGAADAVFAAATRLPSLHPGRIVLFSSIAASSVAEGVAKPVRSVRLTSADLVPQKCSALVVMSRELIDALSSEAVRILGQELKGSVARATDAALLSTLTASSSVESSGGNTWATMVAEIEELMHAVELGNSSRPFLLVSQRAMKGLAAAALAAGVETLGVQGGEIMGIQVIATGGQADGTVTMIDASSLVIADGAIGVRASDHASFQMDDAPSQNSGTPTAATMVSAWQTNTRAVICERSFAAKIVRPNSVASLVNVDWGGGSDSPAGF